MRPLQFVLIAATLAASLFGKQHVVPKTSRGPRALEASLRQACERGRRCTIGLYLKIAGGEMRSHGAGVFVTPDGLVLTAGNVIVGPNQRIDLLLHDGRLVTSTTLGSDKAADLGLLRLDRLEPDIEWAGLGDCRELAPTELLVMFGHPDRIEADRPAVPRFGFFPGVEESGVLRIDCAMMPGDSGGPLFDLHGRVVGVNSRIHRDLAANDHAAVNSAAIDWPRLLAASELRASP